MDMYPYFEYAKVFAAYMTLLYLWPSIIFRKFLNGRGITFRFMFCSMVSVLLVNGIVLMLGLFQVLDLWAVRFVFFIISVFSIGAPLIWKKKSVDNSLKLIGNCEWKLLIRKKLKTIVRKGGVLYKCYKGRMVEYLLLIAILIFGMIYFSTGSLTHFSLGYHDQHTHFRWTLSLKQGKIFDEGIYPEAMHCFIYCMNCLFGIKIFSSMMFLSQIHIITFLLAAYCLLKEVFHNRYIPLFILTAWLTYDAGIEGIAFSRLYSSMVRLRGTYPQEFGIQLVFLCPLILLRFFQMEKGELEGRKWYKNDNLVLMMLAVGAAISIHFYVIIFAFFICLGVILVYFGKVFIIKNSLSLLYAVIQGINIGSLPMILAFFLGINLEHSLQWGMDVVNGVSESAVNYNAGGNNFEAVNRNILRDIYEKGYVAILGEDGAMILVAVSLSIVFLICGCRLYYNCKREQFIKEMLPGYFFVVFASVICIVLYAMPYIGLPEFIALDRMFTIMKMFIFSVPGVLIDLIYLIAIYKKRRNLKVEGVIGCLGCAAIYCFAYQTDFHEYLYRVLVRYNAAALVTEEITEAFHPYTYKIVATFDEERQIEDGEKHEEIAQFLRNTKESQYFLPTEYIFLYVEKHPIKREQKHFFTGPAWIAGESSQFTAENEKHSRCPNILHTELSLEIAQQDSYFFPSPYWNCTDVEMHKLISSKAYYWYQDFSKRNPEVTSVYYEDEDFVCYMIRQDPKAPLNLAVTVQ